MSYLAENWYWIAAAAASGGGLLWLQWQNGLSGSGLSPQEAVLLINREKASVLDVGEAAEYAQGHVRGARHLPLGQLADLAGLAGVAQTAKAAPAATPSKGGAPKGLPSNKQLPLLVVCATGARANKAVAQLKQLGYEQAVALKGGMKAWREANLPFDKADDTPASKAA